MKLNKKVSDVFTEVRLLKDRQDSLTAAFVNAQGGTDSGRPRFKVAKNQHQADVWQSVRGMVRSLTAILQVSYS
jgi:hypothetical protein